MSVSEKGHVQVVLSGPLSTKARYSLMINGEVGSREVRNLIRFLEMQAEWMEEDEAEELAASPLSPNQGGEDEG